MTTTQPIRSCPQCEQPLPADAPEGLCPECLMLGGLETMPLPAGYKPTGRLPEVGETFGGYRIGPELGRGGMGAVFEAEQLETGRRVALKLLNHQLDSPESRTRFLREGRLAASINHPNSVYVFGTEEIGEMPAIVMELVSGGTLEERVKRQGALSVGEGADAAIQIVEGLSAAEEIGILHRDVKPGNCFEDDDGTVKIGDFGLSISTDARDEKHLTMEGAVFGTPTFSSPEQLRGDELNVRSDIYAVGATLFYLLTGRPAFRGRSIAQLFANVLEGPTPSAKEVRPDLPADLVAVVTRCLQKMPAGRYGSYTELRKALTPFRSDALVPAPMLLRFGASVIDWVGYSLVGTLGQLIAFGSLMVVEGLDRSIQLGVLSISLSLWTLYFGLMEGRRGASLGKMICRLRVANTEGNSPGVAVAALRALLILVPASLPTWILLAVNPTAFSPGADPAPIFVISGVFYVIIGLLFCTVRRRNGFASVVDLLTKTRVVRRNRFLQRPAGSREAIEPVSTSEATPQVGPFYVIETVNDEWSIGYDSRLLRKVWIRQVPAGTPPVGAEVRQMGRAGRLRWLAGRRSGEEYWDAFEYPGGHSVQEQAENQAPSWSRVRYWLVDIAEELEAVEKGNATPPLLSLERIWITESGRAKLLDFPVTKTSDDSVSERGLSVSELVDQVAGLAESPIPAHAMAFRKSVVQHSSPSAVLKALRPLLQRNTEVTFARRLAMLAGSMVFPIFVSVMMFVGLGMYRSWNEESPEIIKLSNLVNYRKTVRMFDRQGSNVPEDRLIAIYIASHFRDLISDSTRWNSLLAQSMIPGPQRKFVEQSLVDHPNPSAEEIAEAEAALEQQIAAMQIANIDMPSWTPYAAVPFSLIFYVAIPAIFAALFFRKGLVMLSCGVSVSRKDSRPAGRLRCFWRSLLAWSPWIAAPFVAGLVHPLAGIEVAIIVACIVAPAAVAISLFLPERGLQDRLAGTYLVAK